MEFLEQIALAATLSAVFDRMHVPEGRYNDPLPLRAVIRGPLREAPLDELVHVHYHQWFNQAGFLRQVRPPFDPSSERLRWLEQFLPFAPPPPEPMKPAEMAPVGSGERDGCDRLPRRNRKPGHVSLIVTISYINPQKSATRISAERETGKRNLL